MNEALKTLQALQDTPIPNLLVIGGMVLLFLALVGRIGVIIELPGKRQWIVGVIGTLLLFLGLGLFILDQQPSSSTDTLTAIPSSASPKPPPDARLGDTWPRPKDGMTMVYVPAGSFQMGSADDNPDAEDDEKPQHEVTLDTFWIDRTDVTNAQYTRCVEAGTCWSSALADNAIFNGPDYPVVGVSWQDATKYCQWVGGRLPTEAEWEYAARGPEERIYPWGDTFDSTLLNAAGDSDGYARTAPVDSFQEGASWVGVWNMAGNVWEWVNDWYNSDYYAKSPAQNPPGPATGETKVLRGGSWSSNGAFVRAATRSHGPPVPRDDIFGIRCVVAPGN